MYTQYCTVYPYSTYWYVPQSTQKKSADISPRGRPQCWYIPYGTGTTVRTVRTVRYALQSASYVQYGMYVQKGNKDSDTPQFNQFNLKQSSNINSTNQSNMSPLSSDEIPSDDSPKESEEQPVSKGPALVLGASGEQGQAVIEGLIASGKYSPVYGATRDVSSSGAIEASNMGAILLQLDLDKPETVEKALLETQAKYIFLVTTTDLPPHSTSAKEAEVRLLYSRDCFCAVITICI